MRLIALATALALTTGAAHAQGTLLDKLLGIISGSSSHSYTYNGWVLCDDPVHTLGGCVTTPTGYQVHKVIYFNLNPYECLALIQGARSLGSDGQCL